MAVNNLMTRRRFLASCSVGVVTLGLVNHANLFAGLENPARQASSEQVFLTAHKIGTRHYISGMTETGGELFRLSTPSASHSVVTHSTRADLAVGISRDPGEPAIIFNPFSGKQQALCQPLPKRHFNGHGCISADGQYLFASQNDFQTERGVIAVYHLDTGEHIREFDSYGIDPHELALLNDGQTLVIANGGIQTHPDSGRKPLNIPTMHPNLSYVDSAYGSLIHTLDLPDHLLSIRHLAIGSDDVVGLAMQYQGEREFPPVVGFQVGTQDIQMVKADSDMTHWKMNQYTASVCIHPETGITAITCPRGNLVTFWDSKKAQYLNAIEIFDASGVSLDKQGKNFLITSGTGDLYHINASNLSLAPHNLPKWENAHWGNHLSHLAV